jgi:hypothetical protein
MEKVFGGEAAVAVGGLQWAVGSWQWAVSSGQESWRLAVLLLLKKFISVHQCLFSVLPRVFYHVSNDLSNLTIFHLQ